jgi:hypothetical protein
MAIVAACAITDRDPGKDLLVPTCVERYFVLERKRA